MIKARCALGELLPLATGAKKGLHPAAKFSQSTNSAVSSIDGITILSTDIWAGSINEQSGIYIVKTYPASPNYMYQDAICLYPLKRYWRAKVDYVWQGWIEI